MKDQKQYLLQSSDTPALEDVSKYVPSKRPLRPTKSKLCQKNEIHSKLLKNKKMAAEKIQKNSKENQNSVKICNPNPKTV